MFSNCGWYWESIVAWVSNIKFLPNDSSIIGFSVVKLGSPVKSLIKAEAVSLPLSVNMSGKSMPGINVFLSMPSCVNGL